MSSQESFRTFYDSSLLPVLLTLEAERKMLIRKLLLYSLVAIGLAIPLFFIHPAAAAAPVVITLIIYFWRYDNKLQEKKTRFKREVIGKMISSLHGNLAYDHTRCIAESTYHTSKLYLDKISRYKGDDLVSGTVGSTAIRFCELHTQQVQSNGKNTTVITIFRGLFFTADFNKKFIGETFVLPDTAESAFGSLGTMFQKMNMMRPQLVKLENVEFEKAFAVYGTDQIEARYILSPALMERIMKFRSTTGKKISISFIDSHIYVGIPVGKDLFEASFFTSLIDYELMAEYYYYLALCISIVETLDLNTRIWTKE